MLLAMPSRTCLEVEREEGWDGADAPRKLLRVEDVAAAIL